MNELILGIETSCDETGVALVRDGELLADVTATSMDEYARYGGIIPEIASRAHLESFVPTLDAALAKAGAELGDVDAIAVTAGPGLVGPLTIGVSAAKALALALGKPLYAVNHIVGHIAVDQLVHGEFPKRFIGLVVSGGHSHLLKVDSIADSIEELGGTLDDAAGEAFDKVGRLLGLPYPGGPHIDKLSQQGDPHAIAFPRGLSAGKFKARHQYDYSFSGVKTAVARYIEGLEARGEELPKADIAASFSFAVCDVLIEKAFAACQIHGCDTLVVGGGFSANSMLRAMAEERSQEYAVSVRIPPIRYCTDNGAMIAALGWSVVRAGGLPSPLDVTVNTGLPRQTVVLR
ncbi:MAG: tRNA (adenosine(37)-N6)-threonylcarbamoyltransferase complex transferase subunit TsaD [Trueperella sp.]|uniref:tRNA (adenosine(37)-N6)-threonylcarbamoyltransferase complex transferase subunit TsaD n=1 Tax=Trueperella sp. TaxID=2699835 RepID=UPI0025E9698F|nr:tRNA (adenosine(37)-N6)-threonylcarbamoyltransferase complex transferase subunit TsaD [Trueperella sp.]MCI7305718.1 tRNA (adenosine(37)-N6)-threonylcarbamoyltransferase complex transferase subunit TsaD [Trueperella sp.]